jgi:Right handed beta helix region
VKSSRKGVVAAVAAIAALSATGIGAFVLPNSAKEASRSVIGEATAPEVTGPALVTLSGVSGGVAGTHELSGVSGGVAATHELSGVSGGVVADVGSRLADPAGSPMGDGPLPDAVSPVHAVTATLAHPASKAPIKAKTVTAVPAPAKKKKTSGSSGAGSVAPVALSGDQPGPGNTGVPAGTALTVHDGDLTITTAGATYSGLDIHGFVKVEAPNVTIKDSIVRGGVAPYDIGLVNDVDNSATNFLIEDSELVPADPTVQIDGIKGWNYTALRVDIHGTTDGAKMYGPNATIENSYIHGLVTYAHDPDHGGGQSHNDGVQILSGSNLKIIGNTIEGGTNTALMITQDHGKTSNVIFENNWVSGGVCTVNITPKPLGSLTAITVDNNIFTDNSTRGCPILDTTNTDLSTAGNVFAGTGQSVPVNDKGNNN